MNTTRHEEEVIERKGHSFARTAVTDRSGSRTLEYFIPTFSPKKGNPAAMWGHKAHGSLDARDGRVAGRRLEEPMKTLRIAFSLLAVALIATGASFAFHHGGVAECIGCHSMHSGNQLAPSLLIGIDQSSTCLSCHIGDGGYHVATEATLVDDDGEYPLNLSPGGDFAYMKKDYSWSTGWGGPNVELGQTHGHNIIADDYGYVEDTENSDAPGGTFDADKLHCTSCHDPHGKYRRLADDTIVTTGKPIANSGSYDNSPPPTSEQAVGTYRLLAGKAYDAGSSITFDMDPFAAVVTSSYNRSEATTQTRVGYGKGIADWCTQCHDGMHTNTAPLLVHPVDQNIGSDIKGIYDLYQGSGDMGGQTSTAYLSLVPFAEDGKTYAQLATAADKDDNNLAGPATSDDVTCLSCHRAHASGFEYAVRWNPESELIVEGGKWPGNDNGSSSSYARGRTEAEMQQAYYDRPPDTFATYQRSLCNKCHAKD